MRPRSSEARTSLASSMASRIWWVDMMMVEPRGAPGVGKQFLQHGYCAVVE